MGGYEWQGALTGVQKEEGRKKKSGICTGDNTPRAEPESRAGTGADLISIRRVLLLMRISCQKAER